MKVPFPRFTLRTLVLAAGLLALGAQNAQAVNVTLNTAPFAGSTALTTPGRQVFSGLEMMLPSFNLATDKFVIDGAAFGFNTTLSFVNAPSATLPFTGAGIVVLQDVDDDNNAATPFAAGNAATVIANRVTTDGAGFFVYHNSALNVNRLVYSTNLSDPTADLSVLARINSPTGQGAIDALPQFSSANFVSSVPEPTSAALMCLGLIGGATTLRLRRRR
jgi:hypothetical protein